MKSKWEQFGTIIVSTAMAMCTAIVSTAQAKGVENKDSESPTARTFSSYSTVGLESSSEGIYRANSLLGLGVFSSLANGARTGLLQHGVKPQTLDTLYTVSKSTSPNGMQHLRMEQIIAGLRVHGAYVRAAFDPDNRLIHMIDRVHQFSSTAPLQPGISSGDAMQIAIDQNFGKSAPPVEIELHTEIMSRAAMDSYYFEPPLVEKIVLKGDNGDPEIGFLVMLWRQSDNKLFHTVVDGDGQIVSNELRTANDQYRIFPEHPDASGQVLVNGPGNSTTCTGGANARWLRAPNPSFPLGYSEWKVGCNVQAYLDVDADDIADGLGGFHSMYFHIATADLTQDPGTGTNRAVSAQNLFYLVNVIHDELYDRGFREADGNFQFENGSHGGLERDEVLAETLDGADTNNASFATPVDGMNPRMEMYRWPTPNPDRDGSLDSDIVYHEYGHGLTWRIVGGMSGSVAGALGEGMSDVLAILYNNDDAVAEYASNDPDGIRSSRYGSHTETLANFNASRGIHRNGEIYAATIWDVWTRYQANSLSRDTLMDDIVAGLKLTPSTPTYIQMRDGLLSAAPASRDCHIWRAFAGKGMGQGATMTSSGAVSTSFTVPSPC